MYFLQKKHKQKPLQTHQKTGQKRLFQTKKSKGLNYSVKIGSLTALILAILTFILAPVICLHPTERLFGTDHCCFPSGDMFLLYLHASGGYV